MSKPRKPRILRTPLFASERLGVSRQMVYKLMNENKLKWVRIGADRKIPDDEIDRICAEGTEAAS